jgi:hypothetical protein
MDSRIGRKVFTKRVWIMGIPDVFVVTGIREWIRTATHGFASSTCEGFGDSDGHKCLASIITPTPLASIDSIAT